MAELANSQEAGKFSSSDDDGDSSAVGIDSSQPEQSNRIAKMETGIPNIDLGSVGIKLLRILFSHYCAA
jgi:hypothetical protein